MARDRPIPLEQPVIRTILRVSGDLEVKRVEDSLVLAMGSRPHQSRDGYSPGGSHRGMLCSLKRLIDETEAMSWESRVCRL